MHLTTSLIVPWSFPVGREMALQRDPSSSKSGSLGQRQRANPANGLASFSDRIRSGLSPLFAPSSGTGRRRDDFQKLWMRCKRCMISTSGAPWAAIELQSVLRILLQLASRASSWLACSAIFETRLLAPHRPSIQLHSQFEDCVRQGDSKLQARSQRT